MAGLTTHYDPSDGILQGHEKVEDWIKQHSDPMFRHFVIYHTRLWETQRAIEAGRRKEEQEFISGIDEHLTRATHDLHKVTEYLLTKT